MISPIVVCCLGILNCFFRSSLPQENPPSEWGKKSWWAVRKHHRYCVNMHVNMYVNPCHPTCSHQTAIRTSMEGANLRRSQLWPSSAFPVSVVLSTVVSASALSRCLSLHQTDHDGLALGGVQGCRVGHRTGSHSLCGTDSSQKGHRGAERSRKVLIVSVSLHKELHFHALILVISTLYLFIYVCVCTYVCL